MARPPSSRPSRAARRAAERETRAAGPAASGSPFTLERGLLALWAIATAVFLWSGLAALRLKVSWYLSVDQLGYLLFARDLLHGHVFHAWPPADALATRLPDPTDVLSQSYLWSHGLLYSRYAPGYPLLLAAWTGLFGPDAAFVLNPLLFLMVLGALIALAYRVTGSLWFGTVAAALAFLCPTGLTLWALTPTRDLSAHLCGLLGLTALAGGGPLGILPLAAAGLAVGTAASIRPDAVLYVIPAIILAFGRGRRAGASARLPLLAAAAAGGLLIGLVPSFAYYGYATGNPLHPPQAVELKGFFGPARLDGLEQAPAGPQVGFPPAAWRGGDAEPVSGEGMKLAYLSTTLPGNWAKLRRLYGSTLLALALGGLAVAAVVRPVFALAIGAYVTAALLFYSCWGRPYGRYLVSIYLLAPLLLGHAALGGSELVRRLRARGSAELARGVALVAAVVVAGGYLLADLHPDGSLQLPLTRLVAGTAVATLLAGAFRPAWNADRVAAPALALLLVGFGTVWLSAPTARATVQGGEIARAAEVTRRTFQPRAVLITTEEIGRPAENYEYFTDVHALYLTDLARWQIPVDEAVFLLLVAEQEPYLLLPREMPEAERILAGLRGQFQVDLVADVPPQRNYDYFVASAFHGGVPLQLWHVR